MLFEKVTVIGPGLIGGSLGLDMLKRDLCKQVAGVGHREGSLRKALERGAITSATLHVEEGVREADLVVLATSVRMIPPLARRAIPAMKESALMTDVGSTKTAIVNQIEPLAAGTDGVRFVGSHPLAGSEKRGIEAAREGLFDGSVCIVTPTSRTDPQALEKVSDLWREVGARVMVLDPVTHDRILSHVSHLPHVVAAMLVNLLDDADVGLAASGFRDMTRLASSDPDLWTAICATNRDEIVRALEGLSGEMLKIAKTMKKDDFSALRAYLERAKQRRDALGKDR